jgi:hypothetical protein
LVAVRWAKGEFLVEPRLRRLLTNTAWASSAVTLTNEVLGSSTGNPNQTFFSNQHPILLGQQLDVKEVLPPLEKAALAAQGQFSLTPIGAVTKAATTMGGVELEALWVRWQEVLDFYGSGPNDRHYRLNRLTGEIWFGDGLQGKVPSLGQQNIRLSHYRSGGSKQENRLAHTVRQLKTTIPYVDGVTNYEAASGASDQELLEQVKERGPKKLRHRDRAVTAQDIEDLTFEASPEIARARAVMPTFDDNLDWLSTYLIPFKEDTISIRLTWREQGILTLRATIYGPGQAKFYVQQDIRRGKEAVIDLSAIPASLRSMASSSAVWRLVLSCSDSENSATEVNDISGSVAYIGASQPIGVSRLKKSSQQQG